MKKKLLMGSLFVLGLLGLLGAYQVTPDVQASTCPAVQNTPSFTFAYGTVTVNGSSAPVGTVVEARSPRGDVVGCWVVSSAGNYGAMYVYGEDTSVSPPIPGMRNGETVDFYVGDASATANPSLAWDDDRSPHQVNLSASAASPGVSIPLAAGWNLVSFNVAPDAGNAITDVLSSVMSDLIVAQGYDSGAQSYFPGGAQNTLHTMDALHGYWLKLSAPANLTVPGTKVAVTTTIPLQQGWNLIGYLPDTELSRQAALDPSIPGKYTALLGYDHGAESWYAVLPDSMNTLTMMKPGHGYWIYMTEAADLVYP